MFGEAVPSRITRLAGVAICLRGIVRRGRRTRVDSQPGSGSTDPVINLMAFEMAVFVRTAVLALNASLPRVPIYAAVLADFCTNWRDGECAQQDDEGRKTSQQSKARNKIAYLFHRIPPVRAGVKSRQVSLVKATLRTGRPR